MTGLIVITLLGIVAVWAIPSLAALYTLALTRLTVWIFPSLKTPDPWADPERVRRANEANPWD